MIIKLLVINYIISLLFYLNLIIKYKDIVANSNLDIKSFSFILWWLMIAPITNIMYLTSLTVDMYNYVISKFKK